MPLFKNATKGILKTWKNDLSASRFQERTVFYEFEKALKEKGRYEFLQQYHLVKPNCFSKPYEFYFTFSGLINANLFLKYSVTIKKANQKRGQYFLAFQ